MSTMTTNQTTDGITWETDEELLRAARWRYLNDAAVHAIADTVAMIIISDGDNRDRTETLREVARKAVAVGLLINEVRP